MLKTPSRASTHYGLNVMGSTYFKCIATEIVDAYKEHSKVKILWNAGTECGFRDIKNLLTLWEILLVLSITRWSSTVTLMPFRARIEHVSFPSVIAKLKRVKQSSSGWNKDAFAYIHENHFGSENLLSMRNIREPGFTGRLAGEVTVKVSHGEARFKETMLRSLFVKWLRMMPLHVLGFATNFRFHGSIDFNIRKDLARLTGFQQVTLVAPRWVRKVIRYSCFGIVKIFSSFYPDGSRSLPPISSPAFLFSNSPSLCR
ncbi:hypothetical protein FNV43_RR08172 [Rhamnella rubrinervis]|uniref:Uncharacterized protein n=1 Tax=Rhamnella rubrinervis TaxID=2594499 RepID=A0A8K0MMU6_9ROSA|nr:hypothetical protein FNV43_RR08172 [Rhamnella rubrinervis]